MLLARNTIASSTCSGFVLFLLLIFPHKFCTRDFSKTFDLISIPFTQMMRHNISLIPFWTFPMSFIVDVVNFKTLSAEKFSEPLYKTNVKSSGLIDNRLKLNKMTFLFAKDKKRWRSPGREHENGNVGKIKPRAALLRLTMKRPMNLNVHNKIFM